MNKELLQVLNPIQVEDGVVRIDMHSYQSQATGLNNNDEIQFIINNQDIFTLPHESVLQIEGKLMKADGSTPTTSALANHGLAFLFSEVRYVINDIVIDMTRNVGMTSLMKLYPSYSEEESKTLSMAGWCPNSSNNWLVHTDGTFTGFLPLKLLLGFAEDHKRIILNARQSLYLVRDRSDYNALKGASDQVIDSKIQLLRLLWKVPHVTLSDRKKLSMLNLVQKDKALPIAFRSWCLHEYPLLPTTDTHSWSVKSARSTERPLYVIIGFQTNRKYQQSKDVTLFDHIHLRNIRLFLNNVCFPYEGLELNFSKNKFGPLYDRFAKFQSSYYEKQDCPMLSPQGFKAKAPLIVFDCSYLEESMKITTIDLRVDFETQENVPDHTSAYCLIIHARQVKYHPLSNYVTSM